MSLLNRLLRTGTNEDLSEELNTSIQITNAAALIFTTFIGIPFIIISYFLFYPIVWVPIVGTLGFIVVFPLNKMGQVYASRVLISVFPLLLAIGYIAGTNQPGAIIAPVALIIIASFSTTGLIVFDWQKERKFLLPIFLVCATLVLLHDEINGLVPSVTSGDRNIFLQGPLKYIGGGLGLITLFLVIYSMSFRGAKSNMKANAILAELQEKNERMIKSEKELKDSLERQKTAQEEEENRKWYSDGMAEVNDIIRTKKNAEEVYDTFLGYLIEYINVNQGGIFVVRDTELTDPMEAVLELKAAYAYNKKKYLAKEVVAGESFLGQPYMEGKTYLVNEVPEGYIEITSGLGDAPPQYLAMIPIMEDEGVEGVLELATFDKITDVQLNFLEGACRNLSSFVSNERRQEKLQSLLEQSQMQEEKFRQREEEMNIREQDYLEQIKKLKGQIAGLQAVKA